MLFVCTGPAIWLKTAWPLLPLSCTGAVASQFKANAKKIMMHITVFRMLSPARFNPLDRIHKSNSDNIKIWYGIALGFSCTGWIALRSLPGMDLTGNYGLWHSSSM
jgi:hypothetical protein